MATGTLVTKREEGATPEQLLAWRYYGMPRVQRKKAGKKEPTCGPQVGEVRYIVGWMADQMTRMQWRVKIDGLTSWAVEDIRSDEDADDEEEPEHPLNASERLLKRVSWGKGVVRQTTTNLFVGGELDYVATDDEWQVVSVVHRDRDDLLEHALHKVHGLWPHPAEPDKPDAPLFGVLPVLAELDWLSRQQRGQSANRVGTSGVVGAADGLAFENGGNFWDEFNEAIQSKIQDPTNTAPMTIRGAKELVEPSGSGMGGLSWVIPNFPYDSRIDERIDKAIKRLAYGLPVPPEILLGMQAQSRATAFQVEENSYRAHIEPPATLVAQIAQEALALLLPDQDVVVEPEPARLLARTHTVQDAKDAFDRGAVGFAYLRQALGIPQEAAPDQDELRLMIAIKNTEPIPAGARDPGAVAAGEEALVASVGGPADEPLTESDLDDLSEALQSVDATLLLELGGATQQATERARERVGAKARTREELRDSVPRSVPNDGVAAHLGVQALSDLGVPVDSVIEHALGGLLSWWSARVRDAQEQVVDLLGADAAPEFNVADVQASADLLADAMRTHVVETLESPVAQPLGADVRQHVISVAGGADAVAA